MSLKARTVYILSSEGCAPPLSPPVPAPSAFLPFPLEYLVGFQLVIPVLLFVEMRDVQVCSIALLSL